PPPPRAPPEPAFGPRRALPFPPAPVIELEQEGVEVGFERSHVDARTTVGEVRARGVGQQVAPPHLDGIEPALARDEVHDPFDGEVRLRLPEAAVRADRARRRGYARQRPAVLG